MSSGPSFWARRRAAVQAEAEAEVRAQETAEAQARAEALAEKEDGEILAELGLPNPEEMVSGDDFSAFMSRDVPEHLRKQALRTLWRSNPVLACVDGLNEYDDDYRAAMLLQEPIKTAYQVGKGMMKHIEEMERQATAAAEVEEMPVDPVDPGEDAPVALHGEEEIADTGLAVDTPDPVQVSEADAPEAEPVSLRRMRFHFEEAST